MSRNNDNEEQIEISAENELQTSENVTVQDNMEYPVLSLRDMVVFPENTATLFIGRTMSLKAAQAAYQFGTPLVLLTQKRADIEHPSEEDLYHVGTLARIRRYVVMPDGTLNLAVEGFSRVRLEKLNEFGQHYTAFVKADEMETGDVSEEERGSS